MTAEEELIERRQRKRLREEQVKRIPELEELIQHLNEEVRRLKGHVGKESHKSSLPPSSDRFSHGLRNEMEPVAHRQRYVAP